MTNKILEIGVFLLALAVVMNAALDFAYMAGAQAARKNVVKVYGKGKVLDFPERPA